MACNCIILAQSQNGFSPTSIVYWAIGMFALVFGVFFLSIFLKFGNLWIQAWTSNAPITFPEMIGMNLRKVNLRTVVHAYIRARKAGLPITIYQLETHYLAGGSVPNVVGALVAAKSAGVPLDWGAASAIDLAGGDVLAEIRGLVRDKLRPGVIPADGPAALIDTP
jgi:uncharacterized protein YqfA (UPF0365 family)